MKPKENYVYSTETARDNLRCPYYGKWPGGSDCKGWLDFLSSGYPTIEERGNQAAAMTNFSPWQNICDSDTLDQLQYNNYAFHNMYGFPVDVAIVVYGVDGILPKKQLCNVAKIITTPPINKCQLEDWKNNYMSTLTPKVQEKLDLWKSYGC